MNCEKQIYIAPEIVIIQLDNEISLSMESSPATPDSGDEVFNLSNQHDNDPFKTSNA
ncbi:MAG: hypothetical protein ABFC90_12405 [Bacteroidales bacterium]